MVESVDYLDLLVKDGSTEKEFNMYNEKEVCTWYKAYLKSYFAEKIQYPEGLDNNKGTQSYRDNGCDKCMGSKFYWENKEKKERLCYLKIY